MPIFQFQDLKHVLPICNSRCRPSETRHVMVTLKFDRGAGGVQQTRKPEPLQKSDNRLYNSTAM